MLRKAVMLAALTAPLATEGKAWNDTFFGEIFKAPYEILVAQPDCKRQGEFAFRVHYKAAASISYSYARLEGPVVCTIKQRKADVVMDVPVPCPVDVSIGRQEQEVASRYFTLINRLPQNGRAEGKLAICFSLNAPRILESEVVIHLQGENGWIKVFEENGRDKVAVRLQNRWVWERSNSDSLLSEAFVLSVYVPALELVLPDAPEANVGAVAKIRLWPQQRSLATCEADPECYESTGYGNPQELDDALFDDGVPDPGQRLKCGVAVDGGFIFYKDDECP